MITESIITLGALGLGFGLGLAYLSKKFEVKVDPKISKVREFLPSANCGACGYAGCDAFAEAVACEDEDFKKCTAGADMEKIAEVMGKSVDCSVERKVARILCDGDKKVAKDKFDYKGFEKCSSAAMVAGGQKACGYGCMGYGDCADVCPADAITINKDDLPVVDEMKCISCGKCVLACPKNLYELIPQKNRVYVKCSSKNKGKDVVSACKVGCISCKICERTCKFDAIHVVDNIARIDYEKCVNCGACVLKCPKKIIKKI